MMRKRIYTDEDTDFRASFHMAVTVANTYRRQSRQSKSCKAT